MVEIEIVDCINNILDIVVKKEKRRLYQKQHYQDNKKKYRENHKQYYQDNKEKLKQQTKQYNQDNKEKIKQRTKQYEQDNKEKIKQYKKVYYETPEGKMHNKINGWKNRGLVCDNYEQLYYHYLKTSYCDFCKVELTTDKYNTATTKCMDHCHETGLFRNILCNSCNVKRK